MHIQRLDPAKLFEAYGIQVQMLYPWDGVVEPPFGAAWAVVAPGQSTKHHAHQEGETFFFAKGQGVMRIGDDAVVVGAGDVVYQPPLHRHILENTSQTEDLVFLTVWWEDLRLWADRKVGAEAAGRPHRVMVTAAPPTPNGDLHVGHLSGPYLAGDLHARYLRLRGAEVHYIFGSDDNQSYVQTNAAKMGLAPQAAADVLAGQIQATLAAARIEIEELVRPNASPWHAPIVQSFFRRLYDERKLEAREAPSPYCEPCGRYLYEAYIRGRCPHCGNLTGGNLCEDCGCYNDCVDLLDAVCTQCGAPPARKLFTRLYFPLSRHAGELREYWETVAMNPSLRSLCEQVAAAGLPDIAVTHVADWGIPVPVAGFEDQRIFVWCEMAPRYLAYPRHFGAEWESYWKADDAAVVQCFGFDNGFYYAVLLPALLRAFDPGIHLASAFLMNEFYRLDGLKFSTSRRHAIWGRELLADVPADVLRFHLAATAPEAEGTNFSLPEFADAVDRELLGVWQPWLEELAARMRGEFGGRVPSTGDWTEQHRRFFGRLETLAAEAAAAYEARTFSPQRAARVLGDLVREARRFAKSEESWRRVPARGEERRTAAALEMLAAKLLAILAAPILPDFAARLWRDLGFDTEPRWEDRPSWVPSGQTLRGLAAAPYFESTQEALERRQRSAA
ncbi:MAG TPA: class I tRNA ligase family protein [Thermoanaerobaculia bacterium]